MMEPGTFEEWEAAATAHVHIQPADRSPELTAACADDDLGHWSFHQRVFLRYGGTTPYRVVFARHGPTEVTSDVGDDAMVIFPERVRTWVLDGQRIFFQVSVPSDWAFNTVRSGPDEDEGSGPNPKTWYEPFISHRPSGDCVFFYDTLMKLLPGRVQLFAEEEKRKSDERERAEMRAWEERLHLARTLEDCRTR